MQRYVLLAALVLAALPARAEDNTWYGGLSGDAVFLTDADNSGGGISIQSSYDNGWGISGVFGRKAHDVLRLEAELSYRHSDVNTLTVTNDGGLGVALGVGPLNGLSVSADGNVAATAGMFNAWFEPELGSNLHPYIGGGIGGANIAADISALGVTIVDDSANVLAYQVGLGLAWDMTAMTQLTAGYRYFATDNPSLTDAAGGSFDSEYASHNVTLGARFQF